MPELMLAAMVNFLAMVVMATIDRLFRNDGDVVIIYREVISKPADAKPYFYTYLKNNKGLYVKTFLLMCGVSLFFRIVHTWT